MFTDRLFTKPTALNVAIDDLITKLSEQEAGTKDYTAIAGQLAQLYKLKEIDVKLVLQEIELIEKNEAAKAELQLKEKEFQLKEKAARTDYTLKELDIEAKTKEMKIPFGLKPETVALIVANLAGIALILGHERLNVVTSKALGFVSKLK